MSLPRSAFQTRKQPRAGRPAWKCAEEYKLWLRKLACPKCPHPGDFGNPIIAAHVDHAGGKGVGTKAPDSACIPLCDECHKDQHRIGWLTFEKLLPMADAVVLSSVYWIKWPGRRAWEANLASSPVASRGSLA